MVSNGSSGPHFSSSSSDLLTYKALNMNSLWKATSDSFPFLSHTETNFIYISEKQKFPNLHICSCFFTDQTCLFIWCPGASIKGIIPGFNSTVLKNLPRSMLLIKVESILMGFAFLAMIVVRDAAEDNFMLFYVIFNLMIFLLWFFLTIKICFKILIVVLEALLEEQS